MDLVDNVTGLTYLDVNCHADTIFHSGIMNVVQNNFEVNFQFEQGLNCFGNAVLNREDATVTIYPNPANEILNIRNNDTYLNQQPVIVYNMQGQKTMEAMINANSSLTLDIRVLPAGIYTINLSDNFLRFVKEGE
jgi:hypothetical protein